MFLGGGFWLLRFQFLFALVLVMVLCSPLARGNIPYPTIVHVSYLASYDPFPCRVGLTFHSNRSNVRGVTLRRRVGNFCPESSSGQAFKALYLVSNYYIDVFSRFRLIDFVLRLPPVQRSSRYPNVSVLVHSAIRCPTRVTIAHRLNVFVLWGLVTGPRRLATSVRFLLPYS